MSQALLIEPIGGIAGDMFLAAAVDLGLPLRDLEEALRSLTLSGWRFHLTQQKRHEIGGTHLEVLLKGGSHPGEWHDHRSHSDIVELIESSGLSARAKSMALKTFRVLGEAEAKIHHCTLQDIHFHEVGAVDSIVDICGAAVAWDLLGAPEVYSLPPPMGSGSLKTAHGSMPIPVPATVEILKGLPVSYEGTGELTTPTGAALLKAMARFDPPRGLVVERVGYGLGRKDFPDRANVLRFSLGHLPDQAAGSLRQWETNLDDCPAEWIAHAVERLLEAGAADAWTVPATMKKGRQATVLCALADDKLKAAIEAIFFSETTTFGIRSFPVERSILERRWETAETAYGPIRIKLGTQGGALLQAAPEFEDCKAAAQKHKVSVKTVAAAALAARKAQA